MLMTGIKHDINYVLATSKHVIVNCGLERRNATSNENT